MSVSLKKLLYLQTIESITYHILLASNLSALYFYLPRALYGKIGVLFSIVYLVASLVNAGLDDTLPPFFAKSKIIKINWQLTFVFLPNICLYLIFATFFFWLHPFSLTKTELFLLCFIVATESLKKTAKIILQLHAYIQTTILGELGMMSVYTALVWIGIFFIKPISIMHIFLPLFICSLTELIFFVYKLRIQKQSFFVDTNSTEYKTTQFWWMRFVLYLYAIGNTFTSTNIIIPIISNWYGFNQAAEAKWITSLIMNILFIIKRIADALGVFLFPNQKTTIQFAQTMHIFVYLPIFILCIGSLTYLWNYQIENREITALCIIIPSLDVAFITYRRWLIQKHVLGILLIPYACLSIYLVILFLIYQKEVSGAHLLIAIASSRVFAAVFMSAAMRYLRINSPVLTR